MKSKPKLSVIGPLPPYKGGVPEFTKDLISNLEQKYDLQVISWKRRIPQIIYPGGKQVEDKDTHLLKEDPRFIIDFINPFTWWKAIRKIRKHQPKALVLNWISPAFAPVLFFISYFVKRKNNTKIILLCHGITPHEPRKVDKPLIKLGFSQVDHFIMHFAQDAQELKKIVKNPKTQVGFLPITPQKRNKKPATGYTNTILFFGFIRKYKGLEYLLKAMPLILKEKNIKLIIAGEFWEEKEATLRLIKKLHLETHVEIRDRFIPQEEMEELFTQADAVITPYTSGSLQSAIIKLAYSFNVPVITTRVEGFDKAVKDNITGLLAEPKDAHSLANTILFFYKEKKKEPFSKNIEKFKEEFSWENYTKLIDNIAKY